MILKLFHGLQDSFTTPIRIDPLLPGEIWLQGGTVMNFTASAADPHKRLRQMKLAITLPCGVERATGDDAESIAITIALQLPA